MDTSPPRTQAESTDDSTTIDGPALGALKLAWAGYKWAIRVESTADPDERDANLILARRAASASNADLITVRSTGANPCEIRAL